MRPAIIAAPASRATWLQSPSHDVAMALIWLPFAIGAHAVAGDPERLQWLVSATLLFSFAHQPLTLWLTYGDAGQRRLHSKLFWWAPLVLAALVGVGSAVQPEVVALVAGAWNVGHTIRQRYGISRLYGRLSGVDCASDNRLLWTWLSAAVVIALARTDLSETARDVGLGRRSATAFDVLGSARSIAVILLPVVIGVALFVTIRSIRDESRRQTHSVGRLVYLGSTAMLLAVLAVRPVVGFVAYVGAHAAEYLLVVRWRIGRAAHGARPGDRVGALARRVGTNGTMGVYAVAVVALILAVRVASGSDVVVVVVLTLGALHLFYDGFIWRSARPAADGTPSGNSRSVHQRALKLGR